MASHSFPDDLLTLQRDVQSTYAALAAPRPSSPTTLRRRLHRLTAQLTAHPYWRGVPGGGRAARVELRRQARHHLSEEGDPRTPHLSRDADGEA